MGRDVVDELLHGYPTVFYFIIAVFCLHLVALVYWMYTMFTEPRPEKAKRQTMKKKYEDKGH